MLLGEAHHYFARTHAAVAPACNIQCNYCNRKYDCANESRPGVVSETLTPEEAFRKVIAVANEVPQLSVLGIAGPGDPPATIGAKPTRHSRSSPIRFPISNCAFPPMGLHCLTMSTKSPT